MKSAESARFAQFVGIVMLAHAPDGATGDHHSMPRVRRLGGGGGRSHHVGTQARRLLIDAAALPVTRKRITLPYIVSYIILQLGFLEAWASW